MSLIAAVKSKKNLIENKEGVLTLPDVLPLSKYKFLESQERKLEKKRNNPVDIKFSEKTKIKIHRKGKEPITIDLKKLVEALD